MAPVKNPNSTNKNAANNITNSHSTRPSTAATFHNATTTTVANATNLTTGQRKQTGTVPKSSTKSSINSNTITSGTQLQQQQQQQNGQKPLLHPPGVVQMANRCSPLNIVASIQQQQQQQQQQHMRSQQQHKNTEIVAPIRRELKDLNDYLLTTVVTTTNTTNNLNNQQPQQQQLQQLQTTTNQQQQHSNTTATNSDFEGSQENQQRFCYPVRPIPRRNQQQHNNHPQTQSDFLNSTQNSNTNLNTAIGVVIPTTPGLPTTTNSALPTVQPVSSTNSSAARNENPILGPQFEQQLQLLIVQRLKQLFENTQSQSYQNLASYLFPNLQSSSSATNLANAVLNHNSNDFNQLAQRFQQTLNNNNNNSNNNNNHKVNLENSLQKISTMVHEIPPNTTNREVVVNSNSLEDVALSEMSDRAQSIQSLHSNMETPTPDTTPSYEELQQRLEASNRNIQNMQEQQQQLLKLQNAAKQHLSDMEKLRQQTHTLSFPSGSQRNADSSDGAPDYQSIDQVHSDMASLVGRMKNLTTFIQNQNELSTLMGDDGPEILAEQELLQRKLESLRAQRDEMRNLVSELQNVNRSAEETAKEARKRQYEQEKDIEENEQQQNSPKITQANNKKQSAIVSKEREVPIEYSRNVPIELLQQAQRQQATPNGQNLTESECDNDEEEDEEQRKIAAALIQQKVADIDAMKVQLKRLKDMMETVNLIEAHTAKDPKLIGRTPPREVPITYDRERTPIAQPSHYPGDSTPNEEFIARKVRMLNEVTSDLRAQAESLQSEKDRIQALKNEIERRKQQAAAAVQMGEDALKRNSLTPTPVPREHNSRWEEHQKTQQERDQLKLEYEIKKKEFEMLCKRLKDEEPTTSNRRQDIVSEADDEAEEDNNDSDYAASTKYVPTSTPAAVRSTDQTNRNIKDSLNSTGASSNTATHIAQAASSTHDGASLEGASMQSGSSRSFSIPPPMSAMGMNFPGPIPPPLPTAWNPHQYYYATGVPPPPPPPQNSFGLTQTSSNAAATINTSECICNANNLGATTSSSTATSAATNNPLSTNDPMLQQFIQTQQMLINSVCQCNQMLWHQQREIDSLNQTIHMLQERLLAITAGNVNNAANVNEGGYHLRSESVPPPSLGGIPATQALPNNLFVGINRAQSEQPLTFIPGQNRNSAFSNYQQQQHHQHVYQRHQRISQQQPQGGFNFTTETQQHNTSAAAATSSIYATLNNAASQPPNQATSSTHFNNEIPTPQSPVVGGGGGSAGPAPIFMHHHNNAIHQNNANLRTQNQQQQHHHSNLSHTLNNQVPPGNRANNYWDNFRSYSRQNLLSTNSTKSNEEQQQQQQQQQQQETAFERSPTMPQQQQQQPPPPQPQHPNYNFHQQNQNLDECTNNLNYGSNNDTNSVGRNKYLRIIQRSRINQRQQQQQYQQNIYQQQRDFLQQLNWLEQHENTNNNASNTAADLMYHNYNIQQSNKVGPKSNWRFRNLNEDYNPTTSVINRHQGHTAGTSTQRYQNTLTYQQQQQQQRQQQQQQQPIQHFLNITQQQTAPNETESRNPDFLLRSATVVDVDEGAEEVNYNFLNSQQQQPPQQHQQLPLDYSNPRHDLHNHQNDNMLLDGNENNEDEEEDDEEDDTTSEEIKRNLLVNALKNDKFTTKFYESIKEDVFRRLESMLLDKDNINNETILTQNHQQQPLHQQQLFNNITSNSLRKLNLNEQRGQQQLQQTSHLLDVQTTQNLTLNEEPTRIPQMNVLNNEADLPLSASNNENNDLENDNENEKPEEDTNWRQNIMNNCNAAAANNSTINQTPRSNNTTNTTTTTSITKNITKKRKNLRKQTTSTTTTPTTTLSQNNTINANANTNNSSAAHEDDGGNENLRGACSLAAQQHHKMQQETKDMQNENKNDTNVSSSTNSPKSVASGSKVLQSNEYDLIKYIINRIRNQTHTNTLINDALLVDVAKLTATVAQNAQPLIQNLSVGGGGGNSGTNLSPKKIYAKMKKLSLPKERDEFLRWYQKYLENTIFGNQQQQHHQQQHQHRQQQQQTVEKGKSQTKSSNQDQQQQQQQNDLQTAAAADDGDLAEADQNCSLNNSGGGNCATVIAVNNDINSTYPQHVINGDNSTLPSTATLQLLKTENLNGGLSQYENDENPGENSNTNMENLRDANGNKNITETSNDIINSETPLHAAANNLKRHETTLIVKNHTEKSDLKCEKPEFTEKE